MLHIGSEFAVCGTHLFLKTYLGGGVAPPSQTLGSLLIPLADTKDFNYNDFTYKLILLTNYFTYYNKKYIMLHLLILYVMSLQVRSPILSVIRIVNISIVI
jgi:hypothetical protein